MAFLAYRFIPAGADRGAGRSGAPLRALPPAGWRAGLVMGVFLTAGYVVPDARPRAHERLERRASSPACSWC